MTSRTQSGETAKVVLNQVDLEAARRIIERHPTIINVTDAVRHAIHFTDRAEQVTA